MPRRALLRAPVALDAGTALAPATLVSVTWNDTDS